MRVLVACERTSTTTAAFRRFGVDAYSCDIAPCIGEFPEFHFQCDIFDVLNDDWDLVIAHPPCTYLSNVGNRWRSPARDSLRDDALAFVRRIWTDCDAHYLCVENPVGYLNTRFMRPSQIIHPWMFGDPWDKRTCLWLRNLPCLQPTRVVPSNGSWHNSHHGFDRSRSFPGIASAAASQWIPFVSAQSYQLDLFSL